MTSFYVRWRNRLIAFFYDLSMIAVAWFGAYLVAFDMRVPPPAIITQASLLLIPIIFLQVMAFNYWGLYRGVWRFASIPDLIRIIKAVISGAACISALLLLMQIVVTVPRAVPFLYTLILGLGLSGARLLFRWLREYRFFFGGSKRVMIVGAGNAGESLVRDLLRHKLYRPIMIVDDNPAKWGREIHGVRVVGKCEKIPMLVAKNPVDLIVIAIPSASSAQMRRLVQYCEQTKRPFRTLPGIKHIASGHVDIHLLRDISLEDLLGRDQFKLDWQVAKVLSPKTILVTGGGGSIGSELCRQIANLAPNQLLILDSSEYNLYAIDMELTKKFPHLNLKCLLMNVTDAVGINRIFETYKPDLVFHAAAYKHVPLLEEQARVAIFNNIIGTETLARAAVTHKVEKFVLISTDKAVNPANLMGATKRAAEMICQNLHASFTTSFITVRFGNVLDSAGSVVPLFRQQIRDGGPVTVTHQEITRFFMTIPEAAQLIVQATLLGEGGEIFVLDMGEPVKISYLAEQMIRLAGKQLGQDIEIVYTGLRPGEKLYEELFYHHEKLQNTPQEKIMLATAHKIDKQLVQRALEKMQHAYTEHDDQILLSLLSQLVPEYKNQQAEALSAS